MDEPQNEYHKRVCAETLHRCNPAQTPSCLCWWESDDAEDFVLRSLEARGLREKNNREKP